MKNTTVREDIRQIKDQVQDLMGLKGLVSNLVTAVNTLITAVGTLNTRVGGVETKVAGLDIRVGSLETRFDGLEKITKQNTETIDVLAIRMLGLEETVGYMREEMMTKKDKDEIMSAVDKLTQKHLKLEQEQTMMSYRLQEHDKQIKTLQLAAA